MKNFTVESYTNDTVTLTNEYTYNLCVPVAKFKEHFNLCYAMTVHKSQGMTINEPYTIYESKIMSKKMLYTAMSRATHSKYINFSNIKIKSFTGYLYKFTSKSSKRIYIGSTNNINKRKEDHYNSIDNDKFHVALRKDPSDFVFNIINKKRYIDDKKLRTEELKLIKIHNTVECGFNSINPIAMKKVLQ